MAGFHSDPWQLLHAGKADMVIGGLPNKLDNLAYLPLFKFEIMAVLPIDHAMQNNSRLLAEHFSGETLITYPVPEERIDVIRQLLGPANIAFNRRTAELTIAIIQLVASRRGLAALPNWGIQSYVEHDYVLAKPIGTKGLWSELHAIATNEMIKRPYAKDLVRIIRNVCAEKLSGIKLL